MLERINDTVNIIMSEAKDGNMVLWANDASQNRSRFWDRLNIPEKSVVAGELCHGNNVHVVTEADLGSTIPQTDALVTNVPDACLAVTGADCLPAHFWSSNQQVVAIAHAGWRGVQSKICPAVVQAMYESYGTEPEDIHVFIGPHIRSCHFEVQNAFFNDYPDAKGYSQEREGFTYVDLSAIVYDQLVSVGVLEHQIQTTDVCTYCDDGYFSYRRDKPEQVQAQVAAIRCHKDK